MAVKLAPRNKFEWAIPKFRKDMDYLPVKHIEFTSAKSKKKKLDDTIENSSSNSL